MKLLCLIPTILLSQLSFFSLNTPVREADKTFDGRAYDKNLPMDFTDSSEEEVKLYYNYDEMVQKSGEELKVYLHDKIQEDNYFISYGSGTTYASGGVGCWYKITDRNWELSKEIDPNTYLFDSESPADYRLVNMYYSSEANYNIEKATNNGINSFKTDETLTKIDYENKIKPKPVSGDGKSTGVIRIDKEHVWAKNHGFKVVGENGDVFAKGAPTDLHHLVAADGNTNSAGHNDNFYGQVKDKNTAKTIYCYYADGTSDISGYLGEDQNGEKVFEPTDEWKGDIARCLFYMATRYGVSLPGGNTQAEPYLSFCNPEDKKEDDNTTFIGYHHNLETYLKWNKLDPVSKYEFHRNNLIYKNVQKNRNPFIDYPSLADKVFGSNTETAIEYVKPVDDNPYHKNGDFTNFKENLNLHVSSPYTFDISIDGIQDLNITYDANYLRKDNDNITFTPIKEGETEVTYKFMDDEGESHTYTSHINIKSSISIISLKTDSGVFSNMELVNNQTYEFDIALRGELFENERVEIVSSDPSIISVDGRNVTAHKEGECKLSIILKGDNDIVLHTIECKVTLSEELMRQRRLYLLIIVICAILLAAVFLTFYLIYKKANKKDSRVYTSKVYHKKKGGKKKSSTKKK